MNAIVRSVTRVLSRSAFKVQKHLPEILLVAGVGGAVTSTVMACRATTKAQPVLDEAKNEIDKIHEANSSDEQTKKDLTKVYIQTGKKLVKLYGPSVAVGVASMSCLVGSNVIVRNRLSATLAAYTALSESFRQYRERVEDEIGIPKIEQTVGEGEDAHVIEIEQEIPCYRFIFDKRNPNWKDNVDFNLMYLRGVHRYLESLLDTRTWATVNDFCKEMSFEQTGDGQINGWFKDPKHPELYGDGYVSFGLVDKNGVESENLQAYRRGEVDYIVITLNIDGPIVDRI